eukprot:365428-Chlamydomonas_euryale.AAC.17
MSADAQSEFPPSDSSDVRGPPVPQGDADPRPDSRPKSRLGMPPSPEMLLERINGMSCSSGRIGMPDVSTAPDWRRLWSKAVRLLMSDPAGNMPGGKPLPPLPRQGSATYAESESYDVRLRGAPPPPPLDSRALRGGTSSICFSSFLRARYARK